jgi:hypothetical protein
MDLACLTARVTGFFGRIITATSRQNGTLRKLLDSRRIRTHGWGPRIRLDAPASQIASERSQAVVTGDAL